MASGAPPITYLPSTPLTGREFLHINALRVLALGFAFTITALAIASALKKEAGQDTSLFTAASGIIGFSSFTSLANRCRDIFTKEGYSAINKIAIVMGVLTALVQTILGALGASRTFQQPPANWPLLSGTATSFLIVADWLKNQGRSYNTLKSLAFFLTFGGATLAASSVANTHILALYDAASLSLTTGYCLMAASRGRDIWIHIDSNNINRIGVALSVLCYFSAALSSLLSIVGVINPGIAIPLLLAGFGFLGFIAANMIFRKSPPPISVAAPTDAPPVVVATMREGTQSSNGIELRNTSPGHTATPV